MPFLHQAEGLGRNLPSAHPYLLVHRLATSASVGCEAARAQGTLAPPGCRGNCSSLLLPQTPL